MPVILSTALLDQTQPHSPKIAKRLRRSLKMISQTSLKDVSFVLPYEVATPATPESSTAPLGSSIARHFKAKP